VLIGSPIVIDNNNAAWYGVPFYSSGDPATRKAPTVAPQQGDLPPPPPPPPAVPEVPKAGQYEAPKRSWWNIPGKIYDFAKEVKKDINSMAPDAQIRAQAYAQLADMSDVRNDTVLRAGLPLPKSGTNTIQRFAEGAIHANTFVLGGGFIATAGRGAPVIAVAKNANGIPSNIPGKPFYGRDADKKAFAHLKEHHGVDAIIASDRLHGIKRSNGFSPADNMIFGKSGDVYHPITGEWLGTLTPPKTIRR